MKPLLIADIAIIVVTTSYLTVGFVAPDEIQRLWWEYAVVVFILTIVDLWCDRHKRRSRRRHEQRAE